MSPIDRQLITRKAGLVQKDLAKLEKYKGVSLSEYEKSDEVQLAVERLIERIVSRMIDINYHVLKEEFNLMPTDYHDSFIELGAKEVLPREFSQELAKSAGLRNALAHEYDQIDHKSVHASIVIALSEVPRHLKSILDFIG